MSGTFRVRPAGPDDIPAVLALWARARSANASTPDTPQALTGLLETSPGALLVADEGGAIVGAVIAAWDGWRGNMYRLAVDPVHRRRGLLDRMMRGHLTAIHERGAEAVAAVVLHAAALAVAAAPLATARAAAERVRQRIASQSAG
jgi:ribosomal protein S18 acetylase RimI-like enzyme